MVKLVMGDFKGEPMVMIMRGDVLIGAVYPLDDTKVHVLTHGRLVVREQVSLETLCIIEGRKSSDIIVEFEPKSGVLNDG